MIPMVRETVLRNGWMDEAHFMNFLAVAESTPGPIAINMATYVGSTQGGFGGSLLATLGVVIPSFIIILIIAAILTAIMKNRFVKGFFRGVKPIVFALILSTGIVLGNEVFFNFTYNIETNVVTANMSWEPFLIAIIIGVGIIFTKQAFQRKVNAIYIILIGALAGIVINYAFEDMESSNQIINQVAALIPFI